MFHQKLKIIFMFQQKLKIHSICFRRIMATRRLGRPRTKVYDLNYNLGESYYRGALEGKPRVQFHQDP